MQPFQCPDVQPVPAITNVQILPLVNGDRAVVLTLADITGRKSTFYDADTAEQVGNMLIKSAQQARTGLITAVNLDGLQPPVNGHGG